MYRSLAALKARAHLAKCSTLRAGGQLDSYNYKHAIKHEIVVSQNIANA